MAGYTDRFNEDYDFYIANREKFNFGLPQQIDYNEKGVSAKEAFYIYDSTGKTPECGEPELFREIVSCKRAVNLQIKMWVEGQFDCLLPIKDMLAEFINPPVWVEKAIRRQMGTYWRKRFNGWIC